MNLFKNIKTEEIIPDTTIPTEPSNSTSTNINSTSTNTNPSTNIPQNKRRYQDQKEEILDDSDDEILDDGDEEFNDNIIEFFRMKPKRRKEIQACFVHSF